MEGMISI